MQTDANKKGESELSPKQRQCALMLGRGAGEVECAKKLGVHITTVWRWKQLEAFQKAVEKTTEECLDILREARDDIDKVLVEAAQRPRGSQDRRLYYQLIGKLVERRKDEIGFEPLIIERPMPNFSKMTDEELYKHEMELLAEISRERPKGRLPKPSKQKKGRDRHSVKEIQAKWISY